MRVYRCWFCSSPIYPGHGTLFVRNDCKEFRFCRGKCHKAFKKHRNPRKVKWTKVARRSLGKELTDDLAQSFEMKRNSLMRYERDRVVNAIESVPKITAIKNRREAAFIKRRLFKGLQLRKEEDIKLVKNQMHLLRAPNAKKQEKMVVESDLSSNEEEEEVMDISMQELKSEVDADKAAAAKSRQKKTVTKKKKQKISLNA